MQKLILFFSPAQPQLQLQLSWSELALIYLTNPPRNTCPTYQESVKASLSDKTKLDILDMNFLLHPLSYFIGSTSIEFLHLHYFIWTTSVILLQLYYFSYTTSVILLYLNNFAWNTPTDLPHFYFIWNNLREIL